MSAKGMAATNAWSGGATFGVSPTGSPFTYQNTASGGLLLIVSGGTVTTISYSRDGSTFFPIGLLAGMFTLSPADYLRIVYVTQPTITAIPR